MADQFQMVARIPYSFVEPKRLVVASEAATMDYFQQMGFPIPRIYGHSSTSDNAAGTEYILMELVKGDKLADVWKSLDEQDLIAVVRDLAGMEATMASVCFPAGGSLYYTKDLDQIQEGSSRVPLGPDGRFSIGPDMSPCLWYGRRAHMKVFRGPCTSLIFHLRSFSLKKSPR